MAVRSALARIPRAPAAAAASRAVPVRRFSDERGRVLSEEERAKENVYIQKMERERLEKAKKRAEKEEADKGQASGKKDEGSNKK